MRSSGEKIHNSEFTPYANMGMVKSSDVIGIQLDTEKGTLSFIYNDINLGIAFNSPQLRNENLYAYVSITYPGDTVKCLGFN